MALYVAGETGNKAGRPKGSAKKPSAIVQSLFTRVMKKRYTEAKLNDLLDHVSKRDELQFAGMMAQYTFVKPPQPTKEATLEERLTDEQIIKAYEHLTKDNGLSQAK